MSNELVPPFDLAAERSVLGAALLDREASLAIADLPPGAFYLETHQHIWSAIRALIERREPPDLMTVAAELRRVDRLAVVGGPPYLAELAAEVPTWAHIEYYAQTVRHCAQLRELIYAGGKIAVLGYDRRRPLADVQAEAGRVLQAAQAGTGRSPFAALGDVLADRLSSWEGRGGPPTIPTGLVDLDALTGGLWPSDLIILAARPSVGKTAGALSIAHAVAGVGCRVRVFSLEMDRSQLADRLLAMETGLDLQHIRTGNLRPDEMERAVEGMGRLGDLPIEIDDTPGRGIADLASAARRAQQQAPADLVIVDYLQLMAGDGSDNRNQEVSAISRGLKLLARELQCPVIALSQLSRAVEGRAVKVPQLSDLRDSGAVEQDADLVIFIYRDEVYDARTDRRGIAEWHIAKHRNGPLGVVSLRFDAPTARFQNLTRRHTPEGY